MQQYLNLMQDILDNGERMENRTGIDTLSLFGRQVRFDLKEGFPLVTTKKTHMKSIVHELLWMLKGVSSIDYLKENGVTIWDEWASENYRPEMGLPDGDIGPGYGVQWRHWQGPSTLQQDGKVIRPGEDVDIGPGKFAMVTYEVDQIEEIVDKLKNKPQDRRIILSAWNVGQIHKMKLPPCHLLAQFSVRKTGLACHMYIRSWDYFFGGPFNIAQYALLTHMLAHVTGMPASELTISVGDVHLYVNTVEQSKLQLTREPKKLPKLVLNPKVTHIDDFTYEDISIEDYEHHPAIKGEIAV